MECKHVINFKIAPSVLNTTKLYQQKTHFLHIRYHKVFVFLDSLKVQNGLFHDLSVLNNIALIFHHPLASLNTFNWVLWRTFNYLVAGCNFSQIASNFPCWIMYPGLRSRFYWAEFLSFLKWNRKPKNIRSFNLHWREVITIMLGKKA